MYQKVEVLVNRDGKRQGTRGEALGTRQLSGLQHAILIFLLNKHMIISGAGTKYERNEFYSKGVRWSAKEFHQDCPTNSEKAALSRALGRLAKHGLVVLHDTAQGRGSKPRTTHVRLTEYAMNAALLNWAINHSNGREVTAGAAADLESKAALTPAEAQLLSGYKMLLEAWERREYAP